MSSTVLMCLNLLARTMRCFSTYIIQPVQALSPHDAGPAIAVGLYGGLFPIPGTTFFATVILVYITPKMFSTTMKGLSFAVNAITFPLEIILLPHFIQIGSSFFDDLECEPEQLIAKFYDKDAYLIHNIQESSSCLGAGVLVWLVIAPPVLLLLSTIFTLSLGGKCRSTTVKESRRISV